jgi:hypothetical protein
MMMVIGMVINDMVVLLLLLMKIMVINWKNNYVIDNVDNGQKNVDFDDYDGDDDGGGGVMVMTMMLIHSCSYMSNLVDQFVT